MKNNSTNGSRRRKGTKATVSTVLVLCLVFFVFVYIYGRDRLPEGSIGDLFSSGNVLSELSQSQEKPQDTDSEDGKSPSQSADFSLDSIPPYSNEPFCTVNGGIPTFTESEITTKAFERYTPLDSLGRCGVALSCVGKELMPTEDRESISHIKPTGWHSVQYDHVDGKSLYNRCHLIGFQLTGENANEKNLITGTRYMNVDGMLPFENMIADYVKETGNHVMYRVTPVFEGNELVARGVLMEAYSVEDEGEGISFNVFAYNVQPLVSINYADGTSNLQQSTSKGDAAHYVLNTGSKKFHLSDCPSAKDISEKNKDEFEGSREELLLLGYDPCGYCNP